MNRKEAEKLLAVLIFGDLDEASKTDLTAYLQTDDELRERLADMRMTAKVASDALQYGPDPVLGKRRLKRLARLARRSSRRPAIFSVQSMAAAAAVLIAIILPLFILMPSLGRVKRLAIKNPQMAKKASHDLAGDRNTKYDLEFIGGSSNKLDAKQLAQLESLGYVRGRVQEDFSFSSKPDAYGKTAEESLKGKKVLAKAKPSQNEVTYEDAVVTQAQSTAGNRSKLSEHGLIVDSDVGGIASERIVAFEDSSGSASRLSGRGGAVYSVDGDSLTFSSDRTSPPVVNATLDDLATKTSTAPVILENSSSVSFRDGHKSSGELEIGRPTITAHKKTVRTTSELNTKIASPAKKIPPSSQPRRRPATEINESKRRIRTGNELSWDSYLRHSDTENRKKPVALNTPPPAADNAPPGAIRPESLEPRRVDEAPIGRFAPKPIAQPEGMIRGEKINITGGDAQSLQKAAIKNNVNDRSYKGRPYDGFRNHSNTTRYDSLYKDAAGSSPVGAPATKVPVIAGPDTSKPMSVTDPASPAPTESAVTYARSEQHEGRIRGKSENSWEDKKSKAGNKNDAYGKKLKDISDSGISKPYGTSHSRVTIDLQGKDRAYGITGGRQADDLALIVSDKAMKKNDKDAALSIITIPSRESAIGSEAITDSFTSTNDERFELDEATKEQLPILGDTPIVGLLFKIDGKRQIVGAKDMGSTSESSEVIVSSGEKDEMDAEGRTGLGTDSYEYGYSKVVNSNRPDGFDEPDLPLASGFKSVPVNPWVMSKRDRLSTFALDVDTASYTLCRRYIYNGFLPPAGAVRMEEFVNYFNYHYPQRSDRTFTVHAEAAPSPFAGKGKNLTLLKVGVKARTIGRDQQKAAHLILVVDTSASMGKPDRLGLVQQALNLLIDKLSDADRVTLITCSNQARLHLEATSLQQRDRIRQAINAIQPSGSTNLLAGLKLGYATARRSFDPKGINHVVLCSDGVANVGQTEAELVLKAVAADKKQGITLTCVGVGYGSYNDVFMESLANRGDGSYVFLDSARQGQRVFVKQLAATLHTVAKDARIQVSFNPERVRRYRLIGYENRDIEDKRFRDDTVDAGEVGSGQCSTALYELELTGQRSADQGEGLGTVFVRYRNADTGRMEEISRRLKSSIVQRRKVASSPRFFLAAAASRFAEILRQSEHSRDGSLTDVLAVAEKVSLALPLDRDVRELAELIRKAEHLPRSQ